MADERRMISVQVAADLPDHYLTPGVRVDSPAARLLIDMLSIEKDLRQVVDYCVRLLAELDQDQTDDVVGQAFWTAAVVAYWRCFATGRRAQIRVSDMTADVARVHATLQEQRNKHVSHATGTYEGGTVFALLTRPEHSEREIGTGWISSGLTYPEAPLVIELRAVALEMADQVAEQGRKQYQTVGDEVASEGWESLYAKYLREHGADDRPR